MNLYKTIFISDIHLGSRACKADRLLNFLKVSDAENIYLVGDIIDFWHLKKSRYWPQTHNDVIQKLLRKARHGSNITYIPGNHDEALRSFIPLFLGDNLTLKDTDIYTAVDGKRYLVIHGDQFDMVVKNHKWLVWIGNWGYVWLLRLNSIWSWFRRKIGCKTYWSLSAFVKRQVKEAVKFISNFETFLVTECQERETDGVICGHIHTADIKTIQDKIYINCGDWQESCTAIVEHLDGRFELLRL